MIDIKAELGCDIILNGGLYDMKTFVPECCLKVNGKILSNDGYKYWGYGWNTNHLFITSALEEYDNYISCVCLIKDYKKEKMFLANGLKGSRERTVIGTFDDGKIWVMVQDYPTQTPEDLQNYVLRLGLKDAVMLDGGGSTQGIFPNGKILSERKVNNYICIWEEKEQKQMATTTIQYIPTTNSDGYKNSDFIPTGIVLHSTATPGVNALAMQKYYNKPNLGKSVHAFVDDENIIQCLPWNKKAGHVGSGSKGSFNNEHIGIEMCEPSGLTYNSGGWAIIKYNPPFEYFKKIWENAVFLCAKLCYDYKINPLEKNNLVSHSEAYALGYGSNHADVEHWFKLENKTMDMFRKEVFDKIKTIALVNYNSTTNNIPSAIDKDYIQWKKYMQMYLEEMGSIK